MFFFFFDKPGKKIHRTIILPAISLTFARFNSKVSKVGDFLPQKLHRQRAAVILKAIKFLAHAELTGSGRNWKARNGTQFFDFPLRKEGYLSSFRSPFPFLSKFSNGISGKLLYHLIFTLIIFGVFCQMVSTHKHDGKRYRVTVRAKTWYLHTWKRSPLPWLHNKSHLSQQNQLFHFVYIINRTSQGRLEIPWISHLVLKIVFSEKKFTISM